MKLDKLPYRALAAFVLFLAVSSTADADGRALSISGDGWVAILVALGFVAIIYFVIIGVLKVEERDARLGKHGDETKGWFGTHRDDGDDDDGHHFGGHSG